MEFLKKNIPEEVVLSNRFVGKFAIADGKVDITDPCYEKDTWCAIFDKSVKSGEYSCYVTLMNFPHLVRIENHAEAVAYGAKVGEVKELDDKRIMILRAVHKDFVGCNKRWFKISSSIGVDAGLCGFYNHKPDFREDDSWMDFCNSLKKLEGTHCTCDIKPYGVTVSSGYGDGCYELYAQKHKGEMVALEVRFY